MLAPSSLGPPTDSLATVAAIGLLAYVSADVAHHVLGHGGACWALGGQIEFLSSVLVECSCKSAAVDLAGPLANLLLGAGALAVARRLPGAAASVRLFLLLTAGFNVLYFAGQLLFDVASQTDDWAWPLRYFCVQAPVRYGLLVFGFGVYWLTIRLLGAELAPFSSPQTRLTGLLRRAWVAAGLIACATAALDHPAVSFIFLRAIPQALLLPLGLLAVPALAARQAVPGKVAENLTYSMRWVLWAIAVGSASIALLGPGITSAH